jgi:hypothetical protein
LRDNKGRVVVIGGPEVMLPNCLFYGMANYALLAFSKGLRMDLKG